jgi:hypothetical protein
MMSDHDPNADMISSPPGGRRFRRLGWGAALLAGGALAGAVLAANLPASAGDTSPPPSSSSGVPGADFRDHDHGGDFRHGRETELTGATAARVKTAALKRVPGASVDRLETDADGAVYEAHLMKSDGSRVTVKLNAKFAVTGVETDGPGGHGPGGQEHA